MGHDTHFPHLRALSSGSFYVGCLTATAVAFFAATCSWAQPNDEPEQRRLMPKIECRIMLGERELPRDEIVLPYTVRKEQDGWLSIGPGYVWPPEVVSLSEAVDYYSSVLRRGPESSWVYVMRGIARMEKHDTAERISQDFDAALQIDPQNFLAYCYRAEWHMREERKDRAQSDLDMALRLRPGSALAYYKRAYLSLRKKNKERAFADFSKAIENNPQFAAAYLGRGNLYADREDYDLAIQDYSESIRLEPTTWNYQDRANAWAAKGVLDRALQDYSEALRLNAENIFANVGRAMVCLKLGNYDLAIEDFNKFISYLEILADDEESASIYLARGEAWDSKGDLAKAIADYTKAIELNPKEMMAFAMRAKAWQTKGELDKAIADYNQALVLVPKSPVVLTGRGDTWSDKGDLEKAIADYSEAIQADPQFTWAYFGRAAAWSDLRQYDKAIDDYSAVLRNRDSSGGPKIDVTHRLLGNAYFSQGNFAAALQDFDEALRIDPSRADVHRLRGQTLEKLGRLDDAKAAYERAAQLDPKQRTSETKPPSSS